MNRVIELQKLGRRVNEARNKRKLTIPQLAEKIGVESGSLANIESGNAAPSSDLLFSIADALEVPADYLVADSLKNKKVAVDYMMYDMLLNAPESNRKQLIAMIKAILGVVSEGKSERNKG